jgi:single-strand DNA-binding protein
MRQDDTMATSVEIDAYSVGHDLSYGTTEFTKVSRAQVDRTDRMSDEAVQAAHARASGEADFDAETDEYVVEDDGSFEPAAGALASA